MKNTPLLRMEDICKTFHGIKALDKVNFDLYPGEVHTLVGENGAGKSTLMKILSGSYQSDSGSIFINEKQTQIKSPADAIEIGIGIVYQEFMLAPHLSVAENIFIGREPVKYGDLLDWSKMYENTATLLEELNVRIDPKTRVEDLTVAKRQLVEIAKIISQKPTILILDEPTSSLSDSEVEVLFEKIQVLKSHGIGIIYISHRMDEIKRIADRVTVLRDGQYIGTLEKKQIDLKRIIEMMVGRKDTAIYKRERKIIKRNPVLEVKNLSNDKVKNISFQLHEGEILGFAGLMGAGRSEAMRAIFGIDPTDKGEIFIRGKRIDITHPKEAVRQGIGFAPEDRKEQALFLEKDICTNVSIAMLYKRKGGIRSPQKEYSLTKEFVKKLNIQTPNIYQLTKRLSGGNQQKVVISRWLSIDPDILILDEPTRGIDVGAKTEIYEILSKMVDKGVAAILVSSELQELLAVADRIIVMHEGEITGELSFQDATQQKIMYLATGSNLSGDK